MAADAGADESLEDSPRPIYVIDEYVLQPARLDEFLDAFRTRYLPGAESRGQSLINEWVTPPEPLPGALQTLVLVWRLEGVAGFWGVRSQNSTPEIEAWWRECDDVVEARSRRHAVSPGDRAAFAALGRLNP